MHRLASKSLALFGWAFALCLLSAALVGCESKETGVIEATPDAYTDPNLNPGLLPDTGNTE
jgi:hypothetical protein